VLWGSWARYLATTDRSIVRHDVDLVVSERLGRRFYELAPALRREGFHPILRIPDHELDKVLESAGMSQEPVRREYGGNHQWGLHPEIRNFTLRKLLGVNLDLIFDPASFEATPGHQTWVKDGDHDHLVRAVEFWEGSEILFDNPLHSKMGLLVPSVESQVQFGRVLSPRTQPWSAREKGRATAQLERAHERRPVL
jgi:hypothetical protein